MKQGCSRQGAAGGGINSTAGSICSRFRCTSGGERPPRIARVTCNINRPHGPKGWLFFLPATAAMRIYRVPQRPRRKCAVIRVVCLIYGFFDVLYAVLITVWVREVVTKRVSLGERVSFSMNSMLGFYCSSVNSCASLLLLRVIYEMFSRGLGR